MSRTKMICPNCGKPMTFDVATTTIMCRECGFTPLYHDNRSQSGGRDKALPATMITYRGTLEMRVRGMWDQAHAYLRQGKNKEALQQFRAAVDYQPDFTDAHLWIARLVDDPKEKRDRLETVLAYDPNHQEALRDMMVLRGRMSEEQAAKTHHFDDPETRLVSGPVEMKTQALICPICNGHMTVNERSGQVECRFCGHIEEQVTEKRAERLDALGMALLERKSQPVRWVVGERILRCGNCGAERTIPGRKMSQTCVFCGSTHVMTSDALNSFVQPDGLLPFKITRDEASGYIRQKLKGAVEQFKNLFDRSDVAHAELEGLYIPYWVFDGVVEVTRSTIDKRTFNKQVMPYARETFSDGVYNIATCGVTSPPPVLTDKLGAWDWGAMIAYDPLLLAKYPAELYSVDFDRASLMTHVPISALMKARYDLPDTDDIETTIFTSVKQMTFQLVLVPVWVATLFERDGDVRAALVNGQTGETVLGKPQKPKK